MAYRFSRKHPVISGLVIIISALIVLAQQQGWLSNAKQAAVVDQPGLYTVTHFVDGDTIAVTMNGHEEKIRFIGVDTPETHKPNTPVQCYGPAAAAFTKTVLGIQKIRLVSDEKTTDRDRYGRLLRYIYLPDGSNFNETLIQTGHAFYYPYFPFTKSEAFAADQVTAMATHKGLWGNCVPIKTDKGGYTSPPQ